MDDIRASKARPARTVRARAATEVIAAIVVMCGAVLFVRNGTLAMQASFSQMFGSEKAADTALQIALLLNVALILFGWQRLRDLAREVEERSNAEQRAKTLASTDSLTGFDNRRSLAESGMALLANCGARGSAVATLLLDLDHFKTINDLHGHSVGDDLLRAVAAELEQIAPPNSLLARLGGDEFVCVMAFDPANKSLVDEVAMAMVSRLSKPFDISGLHAHISVSVGIADSAAEQTSFESLLRRADIAMYVAKRGGRNRALWFELMMETQLLERAALEEEIRAGITDGQFVPYFEKQIEIATGRLLGFEVLARWNHPTKGLIAPTDFIPMAEECGVISDLSLQVIKKALMEARHWDPSLTISVNLAPTQLRDPWLAHKIVKMLAETGFAASRLEIEITEAALYDNLEVAKSIIDSLKNQGVRLALDDFGIGYSSLAHLRALPFDRIKMDKSFAMSIEENDENAAVINAVNQLGDSLAITVSVKGIEDESARATLSKIGCTKGQGWFYGKPTSITATRSILAQHNMLSSGDTSDHDVAADQHDLGYVPTVGSRSQIG